MLLHDWGRIHLGSPSLRVGASTTLILFLYGKEQMTWLSELDEYGSDDALSSYTALDNDVLWRGATASPTPEEDWVRALENSLCLDETRTNSKEGGECTNSKEGEDERFYMGGAKAPWICQRCGTVVTKGNLTQIPQLCNVVCKRNTYLCGKTGVLVDIHRLKKPRFSSQNYCMARIFHTESRGTPFEIDVDAGSMRVTIPPVPGGVDFPHGKVTYRLHNTTSIPALREKLGRGLAGTVAENVDRDRPEEVVVQPAGGGPTITIENPQFQILFEGETVTPVSNDLPLIPDPTNIGVANDLPRLKRKRTRVEVPVEPDATDYFEDALETSPPPAIRRRTALDVTAYIDDESSEPSTFTDVESLNMLALHLYVSHDRMGDDGDDVAIVLPSREELTQQVWDNAIASDKGTLEVLVYSKSAASDDEEPGPSTQLRDIEGMTGFGNPLSSNFFEEESDVNMTTPAEEEEEDRLVEDDESVLVDEKYSDDEEEEGEDGEGGEEETDPWNGRTALDADPDARMNTPFPVPEGGHMTLAQYLEEHPDLLPWVDFISPHRLTMLDDVPHPFLVLTALFFDGAVTEAQRFINMHNNAKRLTEFGLGAASFDELFLQGIRWDVSIITNAAGMKRERERKEAEKRAMRERRAAEQEAERERKRREKDEAGRVRDAARKADAARRKALAEENRRVQTELREEDKRRRREEKALQREDKAAMRDLERMMKPGLKQMETNEERQVHRSEAQERYRRLPWALKSIPDGVARHPEGGNPILFTEVPEIVRTTLFWLMAYRLYLHLHDPLSGEMIFRNISRYYGNPPGGGTRDKRNFNVRQWRSWQLQRKVPGTSGFLGQYIESILAALVNAASIVDPRIDSSDSALSWLIWILDPQNAERWLRDPVVVQGLQEQEHHPVGRTMSRAQDKYDAEFRQHNPTYVAPLPTVLNIPETTMPPPPPPPPFAADPTIPLPPPHPTAAPSDAGTSSSVAGSSTDVVLPVPDPLPPLPNVEGASTLYDLHNELHPGGNASLGDMLDLLENMNGDVERAADSLIGEDDDASRMVKYRDYVRLMGATPDTARYLRDEGVSAAEILDLGLFDLSNLIGVFTVDSLVLAGASPYDLLDLGASADALRDHVPRSILENYGYDMG